MRHKAACDIAITSVVKVSTKVKGLAQGHVEIVHDSPLMGSNHQPSGYQRWALTITLHPITWPRADVTMVMPCTENCTTVVTCKMLMKPKVTSLTRKCSPRWKQDNGFLSKPLGRHNGIMDQRMTSVLFLKIKTLQCTRLLDIL